MKSKEELVKQVIILVIALIVTIIVAVVLNVKVKDDKELQVTTKESQEKINSINSQKDELMNNLKGLLEPPTQNEFQDSQTIQQPIETGVKEELKNKNNEVIQYKEKWNGDN